MKFFNEMNILVTLTLISLLASVCLATNTQAQSENSMMEFMNSFFSNGLASGDDDSQFRFKEQKPKGKKPVASAKKKGKKVSGKGKNSTADGNSTLENWFMIQSPEFRNPNKFPLIVEGDGSPSQIQVDHDNWRINSAYKHLAKGNKPLSKEFFWFRLVGLNIYYSTTKSDMNVLGAIPIKSIRTLDKNSGPYVGTLMNSTYCLDIVDAENNSWKICTTTKKVVHQWSCRIFKHLGIKDESCKKNFKEPLVFDKKVMQPIIVFPVPSRHCNDGWNYTYRGSNWECDCREGKEQSPIDLPCSEKAIDTPIKPIFQYDHVDPVSSETTLEGQLKKERNMKIVYKDNTLRIFHFKFGKAVTVDGAVYFAQEIAFHVPSEHTINGKQYDMEVQIIHYGQSMGDIGKQLSLSFLIEKTPGVYNKFFDDLDFFNLPNPLAPERDLYNNIFIPNIFYDTEDNELPAMKFFSFYTYQGSLTFPPCTENTIVYVAANPIKLGSTAIALFTEALRYHDMKDEKGNITPNNIEPRSNREVQPRNGRPVFYFDSVKYCGPEQQKLPSRAGHFEKILKTKTDYVYVTGNRASGMPGAFVVSDKEAQP